MITNIVSNANYNYSDNLTNVQDNQKISAMIPVHKPSVESIRKDAKEIKKLYTDPLNIPNLLSIFQLPFDAARYYKALNESYFHKEKESILEAKLKLCSTTVNATYSFSAITNGLTIFRELSSFGSSFPFLGIAASAVSGGLEIKNIIRQTTFIARCKTALKRLKKDPNDLQAYDFLNRFLGTSSSSNKLQQLRLAQRVKPWFAEKFTIEFPDALEKKDTAKALSLLKSATIQAEKKTIQHTISLLCNLLILTACAGLIVGAPYTFPIFLLGSVFVMYTIPTVLFGGVFVLAAINYMFGKGTDQIGWKFNPEYCIPFWRQNHNV